MQFATVPPAMLSSEVNKVFARFDVDGSGFLSRDRFKSAYVKFCGRYQSVFHLLPFCCVDSMMTATFKLHARTIWTAAQSSRIHTI